MIPPTMPGRLGGSTAIRIISQRVAPSASAASFWSAGTWSRTSRAMAAMIGRIMIARMTAAPNTDLLKLSTSPSEPPNSGTQPKLWLRNDCRPTRCGSRKNNPHSP